MASTSQSMYVQFSGLSCEEGQTKSHQLKPDTCHLLSLQKTLNLGSVFESLSPQLSQLWTLFPAEYVVPGLLLLGGALVSSCRFAHYNMHIA